MRDPQEIHQFKVSSSKKSLPGDEVLSLNLAVPPEEEKEIEVQEARTNKEPMVSSSRNSGSRIKSVKNAVPKPIDVVCRCINQWVGQKTFDYLQNESIQCEEKKELNLVQTKLGNLQLEDSTSGQKQKVLKEAELKIKAFLAGKTEYDVEEAREKRSSQTVNMEETHSYEDHCFSTSRFSFSESITKENCH